MSVTPQNFPEKVTIALPSADAAAKTIDTSREQYPGGFEFKALEGPRATRLNPLRDAETNSQLIVTGKIRNELECLFKNTPVL
eukprot:5627112-Pyramimonas_sp.AAC.1